MHDWSHLETAARNLAWPAVAFAVAFLVSLLVRHLVLRRLARWPVLASSLRAPSWLWCVALALHAALDTADLTAHQAQRATQLIGAAVVISLTLVIAAAMERMLAAYGERQGMPIAVTGLSRALIRVVVAAFGAAALLATFGVQVTPLLAALGVGGLAVALALQDTLANLFAGVHILMERPLFVGDFIRLDNGQEGVVTDIGWRTTRLRTGANDIVVIPNVKITSGILVNYSLPEHRSATEVSILVAHDADPDAVMRIALEEAAQVPGVLADPAPACTCDPGVLLTHMQFKLAIQVARRQDQWRVQSAIRMRLLKRFRAEGIPLPVPERALAQRV